MINVLFVCTGNTCRSPMAEGFFNRMARASGLNAEARSAGLSVYAPGGASYGAQNAVYKYGVDITNHISRQISLEMLEKADMVYCMTRAHLQSLSAFAPQYAGKLKTLAVQDTPDPYGGTAADYDRAAAAIWMAVGSLVEQLGGQRQSG